MDGLQRNIAPQRVKDAVGLPIAKEHPNDSEA